MKYLAILLISVILGSCSQPLPTDGVVEIHGTRGERQVVRGMGVCLDDGRILTSAHVVRDDALRYVGHMTHDAGIGEDLTVTARDIETDIASLKVMNNEQGAMSILCNTPREYIGKTGLQVGDALSIPVIRSGSLMTLTGMITSVSGVVFAYDMSGRTQVLSGMLMTDIVLRPGDSGAPILDEDGRVVDLVHIE